MAKIKNNNAASDVGTDDVQSSRSALSGSWIQDVDRALGLTAGESAPTVRTMLSCHVTDERRMLYVPPEMTTLQERGLSYLGVLAMRNDFQMAEDRRRADINTINEQREGRPAAAALGLALMMQQAGLQGSTASLSRPHRLGPASPLIDVPDLISMSAYAAPSSKQIVLLPNQPLLEVLDNNTQPIAGFGCHLQTRQTPTLLTHFHAEFLRCIGYSTGGQYVMHLLLGGGPLSSPSLWTRPRTLTRTDIRFRLFLGHDPAQDFGLLYSTFYYNMSERIPLPWWLHETQPAAEIEAQADAEIDTLAEAG